MIARLICRLFGHSHSRGAVSDRIETESTGIAGLVKHVRYCSCCGQRADSFSLVRRVQLGYLLPRGYGVAWVRWHTPEAVAMPVPLNLIAGAARRAWFWCKAPRFLYQDPRAAYHIGLRHGREQAIKDAANVK